MNNHGNISLGLKGILGRELSVSQATVKVLSVGAFVVLTALGAYVRVPLPFTPVPITLQTFFVLLAACCLGANLASLSQAVYIVLGVAGLPLFSGLAGGMSVVFGPTGGYILGFMLGAYIVGSMIRRRDSFIWYLAVLSLGSLIILIAGSIWLKFIMHISLHQAFGLGALPFLAGDSLKVAAVAVFYAIYRNKFRAFTDRPADKDLTVY